MKFEFGWGGLGKWVIEWLWGKRAKLPYYIEYTGKAYIVRQTPLDSFGEYQSEMEARMKIADLKINPPRLIYPDNDKADAQNPMPGVLSDAGDRLRLHSVGSHSPEEARRAG